MNKKTIGLLVALVILIAGGFFLIKRENGPEYGKTPTVTYEGILYQQGGDFFLRTAAPKGGAEVSYALPLKIKISNALATLVGKEVKVSGNFTAGNTLEVDTLEEVKNPGMLTLHIGETDYINGVRITLNKEISDSRCPTNAQCITAGFASFEVALKSDTDHETVTMQSNQPPRPFDSFRVAIVTVEPAPVIGQTIAPQDYAVTFKVTAL